MMISVGINYTLEKHLRLKKKQRVSSVVLWEVIKAKYIVQMSYLSPGTAWLNDASLNEVCYSGICDIL